MGHGLNDTFLNRNRIIPKHHLEIGYNLKTVNSLFFNPTFKSIFLMIGALKEVKKESNP